MKTLSFSIAAFLFISMSLVFAETESIVVSGLEFEYEDPWIRQQPASSMRAGQLLYDHEDESLKDIELVLFYFGGGGGSIQANIDRWIGQFDPAPESSTEEEEIDGTKITFLTASGTYMESSGGPFSGNKTPRPDYTMLAAIIPGTEGPVFLKLTGPNDSVAAMKEAFLAFAKSPFGE
ncbi:MAG: hypothetical protein AAGC68_11300 [Verrucomicrobiota bacterium]